MGEKRTKKLFEEGFERIKEADGDDLMDILKKAGIPLKIADEVKDRLETRTRLHLCPNCGAFVPADAEVCPICGADLSAGEEEIDFTSTETNDITQLEDDLFFDDEPSSLYLCRVCGAFITDKNESCPVCGASMPENRADMPVFVEDKLQDEERNIRSIQGFFGVQDISKLENIDATVLDSVTEVDICSSCGAFVRPEAEVCPVCGTPFIPEMDEEEERAVADEALMELEILKNELIGGEMEEILPEEEKEEYLCPECGAPVSESATSCPECGALFADETELEEAKETHSELVLSLEEVLAEEDISEARSEAVRTTPPEPVAEVSEYDFEDEEEDERIKEEMKEEVDFIFAPPLAASHGKEKSISTPEEKEELAKVLEGGMDDSIALPEEASGREESALTLSTEEPSPDEIRRWTRYEDIVMAASAIGAALMASEYLLTNGVVPNPLMAYGIASLSIFIPLLLAGFVFLFLDRAFVFRDKRAAAIGAFPLFFSLFAVARWFFPFETDQPLIIDALYLALYFAALSFIWFTIKERLDPFMIWFLGIFQIVVHSLVFFNGDYPWLAASDPIPTYTLAVTGGITLSIGIYLRIDAAVRSLLATRDVLMGHRYYVSGDYEDAMKYYSRALNRKRPYESGYDLAYYSKGTAMLSAGNALEALKYLNRAVKANPNNEMAWNNRGIALSKLGLDEGALKSYEKALMINSSYDVAWNNKGNTLARMGMYAEALECYDHAIQLNPNYKDAWMNKGYVLIKLDRYGEAKQCAEYVLRPNRKKNIPHGIFVDVE